MPKDDLAYLGHILDTARKVLEKIRGKSRAKFDADENLRLALTHLLQIIGEAAGRISADFRQHHSEIPWKAIIGMRHKVVHDYMNVDENVVWRTATEELPDLVTRLESLMRQKAEGDGP